MVLSRKRGLSKLEFYNNARKMRKELTLLTLRDFGIHSRGARFKADTNSQQPEGFYDELLAEFSKNTRNILRKMMMKITAANTIYPVNKKELRKRRKHQTAAIIKCEQLMQEFLYCEDVLPVKASKFAPYVERVEKEISLLKGWRKANNKIKALIEKRKKERKEKKEREAAKEKNKGDI